MSGSTAGGLASPHGTEASLEQTTQLDTHSAAGTPSSGDKEVYELIAEFWVKNLGNLREALDNHMKGLEGAERQKVAAIRDQVDKHVKALEDNKRKGPLNTLMKVLGPVLTALSIAVAVLVPSPMTIAMAAIAVAMFIEPMISKAAGKDSLIEQGMGKLMEEMAKHMPPEAAAVLTAVIVTVAVVMVTAGVAAGLSAISGALGTSAASATTAAAGKASTAATNAAKSGASGTNQAAGGAAANSGRTLTQTLLKGLGITPQHNQFEAVAKVLEYIETLLTMAKAGVQMDIALVNFELAKALKEFSIDQAQIDHLGSLINMVLTDVGNMREHMENLINMLSELFDRQHLNLEFS